jgi:SulP family sulfate permease
MIGGKHSSNTELIAEGIANICSPIFGGIPVTGAIARTATNIKNGGRTPIAGVVHAVTLLLIMLLFGRWAKLIPMATLAAILMVVSYNMCGQKVFRQLLKSPKGDVIVLLTTFLLTVIFDLTVAIEVGMVLAVILFMRQMAAVSNVGLFTQELSDEEEQNDPNGIGGKDVPDGVEVYEINGPFFFGAVAKFKEAMSDVERPPKVRIIRMRNVNAIDASGLNLLREVVAESKKEKTHLLFAGVHAQPLFAFTKYGLIDMIGEENIFGNIDDALDTARIFLGKAKHGRPEDFIPEVAREIPGGPHF